MISKLLENDYKWFWINLKSKLFVNAGETCYMGESDEGEVRLAHGGREGQGVPRATNK